MPDGIQRCLFLAYPSTLTFPAKSGTLKFLSVWELGVFYCLSACLRVRWRNHVYSHVTRIPGTFSYFCKRWSLQRESRKLDPFALPTDICAFGMHAFCGMPVLRGQCFVQFRWTAPMRQTNFELWLADVPESVPPSFLPSYISLVHWVDQFDHHGGCKLDSFRSLCTIFWYAELSLQHHYTPYSQLVMNCGGTIFDI